jgi:uncharacterized protein (TIGR03083 family)
MLAGRPATSQISTCRAGSPDVARASHPAAWEPPGPAVRFRNVSNESTPPPAVAVYTAVRERVTELAGRLSADRLDAPVPACPLWNVRDVVAHLAGTARDVCTGNVTGASSPEWTAAQVEARRGRDVGALLAEWAEDAARIQGALASRGGTQIVMDALTHEQDLRRALDAPYSPADDELVLGLKFLAPRFALAVDRLAATRPGLGSIEAHSGGRTWRLGAGDPRITLRADALDLMRSLTGRRTLGQIARLDWSGDPAPWLPAFAWGVFTPTPEPVEPLHGTSTRT